MTAKFIPPIGNPKLLPPAGGLLKGKPKTGHAGGPVIIGRETTIKPYEELQRMMQIALHDRFENSVSAVSEFLQGKKVDGTRAVPQAFTVFVKRLEVNLSRWESEYNLSKNKNMSLKWHRREDAQTHNVLYYVAASFKTVIQSRGQLADLHDTFSKDTVDIPNIGRVSATHAESSPMASKILETWNLLLKAQKAWEMGDNDALQELSSERQVDLLAKIRQVVKYLSDIK